MLASLAANESQLQCITDRLSPLKTMVSQWVNVNDSSFEFHASDIFNGRNIWRPLPRHQRPVVLRQLRKTFLDMNLATALVLVDKDQGGIRGLDDLKVEIADISKRAEATYPDLAKSLQESFPNLSKDGFGPLGNLTGLLLGLTSGLMDKCDIAGDAPIFADEQCLKALPRWEMILTSLASAWPYLSILDPIAVGSRPLSGKWRQEIELPRLIPVPTRVSNSRTLLHLPQKFLGNSTRTGIYRHRQSRCSQIQRLLGRLGCSITARIKRIYETQTIQEAQIIPYAIAQLLPQHGSVWAERPMIDLVDTTPEPLVPSHRQRPAQVRQQPCASLLAAPSSPPRRSAPSLYPS